MAARCVRCVGAAALVAFVAACGGGGGAGAVRLRGTSVEVLAVWQDVEADRFGRVLDAFERATGADVRYTSTAGEDIAAVLDRRIAAGDVPDLALLPQPGLLWRYAEEGYLVPIDGIVGSAAESWAPEWRRLATVDGRLYGLWFKAAHKSLVWYDIATFERAGVVPPSYLEGLVAVGEAVAATGIPAFAIAAEDPWTLTDWFENLYLRLAGPERYDALAEHRLPWTDPTVRDTLAFLGQVLSPPLAGGGPDGVQGTTFEESVDLVFGRHGPGAAMVMEGDFVAGVITGSTTAQLGVDADVFRFPDVDASRRLVVAGGDAVVVLGSTPASRALLRYLATPAAAEVWARMGGFVSPNDDVDLTVYRDRVTRAIARSLIEAGDGFRFDLSDLQPPEFGGRTDAGMRGILRAFATDPRDVDATAAQLEAAASAADAGVSVTRARGGRAMPEPRRAGRSRQPRPASSAVGGRSS